jgi:predicted nucleic acid-binding protein
MYVDAAYVAKFYLNEPDAPAVRKAISSADSLVTSAWSMSEVSCVFHRHFREGGLTALQYQILVKEFLLHVEHELWILVPVTNSLLRRVTASMATLPPDVFLRAGDAIHLISALEAGESEVWTSDRHMLAAAAHFGLTGRRA